MIIYKCKMCGGNLKITEGSKITTCEYCQTQQTVPTTDDEKRVNLFNKANHFRQNSEFDKAMGVYEHILGEDSSDAEAYWAIVLCKYGIEYVKDPVTKMQKPTVNRTQAQSILKDADYLMALDHADYTQKALYEKEAKEIDQIQKNILMIAQNEQPYDIFISYKEKTSRGERTKSSVLAQDVYSHLTKEGFRVFFSRISLEDKIGQKYEPYIYSALNSAKIMLVIGTEKEEFTAPWVKNEWSRFLTMMREDASKMLIPCFRDIEIDDLPNEFQVLQSQDMSRIGFEQDILRGINKFLKSGNEQIQKTDSKSLKRLLQNAETYIKIQNYDAACTAYQEITKLYPEDYRGWWGLIEGGTDGFTNAHISKEEKLKYNELFGYVKKLADESAYQKVLDFYISYLRKVSDFQVEEELGFVKSLIKKLENEKREIKKKINNLIVLKEQKNMDREQENKRFQAELELCEKEAEKLDSEATKIVFLKGLAWTVFVGSLGIGWLLQIMSDMSGEKLTWIGIWIFWLGGAIGLYLINWVFYHFSSAASVREKANKMWDSIVELEQSEEERAEQYASDIETLATKVNSLKEDITVCDKKILLCNEYMELGKDAIANLLWVFNCKEIGISQELDTNAYGLRNKLIQEYQRIKEKGVHNRRGESEL